MPPIADSFTQDAAQFDGAVRGEDVDITVKGGTLTTVGGVIVLRGSGAAQLATRREDAGKRLEDEIQVQVPIALYPATRPNIQGDQIAVAVRRGDTVRTPKKVSSLINQVNGMWHLKLD